MCLCVCEPVCECERVCVCDCTTVGAGGCSGGIDGAVIGWEWHLLFLAGSHTQMIGSSWGAAVVAMPPPLHFMILSHISCIPYIVLSMSWPLFYYCLSVVAFPVSACFIPPPLGSPIAPRWGSAVSAQLDPSARPLAPIAPVTLVCPTLSQLLGNPHSSIAAGRQIYMFNRCFTNRLDRNNPAKSAKKR